MCLLPKLSYKEINGFKHRKFANKDIRVMINPKQSNVHKELTSIVVQSIFSVDVSVLGVIVAHD